MIFAALRQITPVKMHLDITVPYQNAPAHYSVLKEAEGIYLAILQHYEGSQEQAPPLRIVLVKSIRNWTGSFEDSEFIKTMGKTIEKQVFSWRHKDPTG